jgi:hypothetical protein
MSQKKVIKPIALAVGAALAGSFAIGSVANADTLDSPFAMSTLTAGYMLWLAHSHSLLSSTLARIPGLKFLDPLSESADLDE